MTIQVFVKKANLMYFYFKVDVTLGILVVMFETVTVVMRIVKFNYWIVEKAN